MNAHTPVLQSPFHAGEREAQMRAGKRDVVEAIGKSVIRPFMPDQHRDFFQQLPFIILGSVDEDGWPWASILSGGDGFIASPNRSRLDLKITALEDDPIKTSLHAGAPIGLLGIEVATRRRNRMNAKVATLSEGIVSLDVVQSFGNCPQYIQTRDISFVRDPDEEVARKPADRFTRLDPIASAFIANADTFFVSSFANTAQNPVADGVDVSHRGGRAGFVRVDGDKLAIPDYSGNNFFNTIGNFLVNPKAGLLFPDFATGDLLMLTGTVEVLWEDHREVTEFKGAERAWRFTLDHGIRIHNALPFRAKFGDYSPNSLMTDNWAIMEARKQAELQRNVWRPLRVTKIRNESSVIRSFTFEPIDDHPLLPFQAGQFLTIRFLPEGAEPQIRNYTISSAPDDVGYRISVKREPGGPVSNYLHETLNVGDVIETMAPQGSFYLDALEKRPAVLIAGGVGITPMMSMMRHVMNETVRKRFTRSLTVIHAARTTQQRAFADDLRAAEAATGGKIRYVSVISNPGEIEKAGHDFDATGHIDADLLRSYLALDDYDYFLCGPPSFMQAVYDSLCMLGASDARIFAESFGPAALSRSTDDGSPVIDSESEAEMTNIKFNASGFEQRWEKGDATLLETAEAHGLSPGFSCRSGTCGSCATKMLSGSVVYRTPVTAEHTDDEVLICCAVPAAGQQELVLEL